MRLLTLCVLALLASVSAVGARDANVATASPQAAGDARYSTNKEYYLQAWDGKSDPISNPKFQLVGHRKFVIENQQCFRGMEFTIKSVSGNAEEWYNPALCPVTPGNLSSCKIREIFQVAKNWKIQEDGIYDFILTETGSGDHNVMWLIVQKHGQSDPAWKASLFTNTAEEDPSAPKSSALAEPVKGVYHHFTPNQIKDTEFASELTNTITLTGPDGKEYGYIPDDNNSCKPNATTCLKPLTIVDMVAKETNADAIDFRSPEDHGLFLFNTSDNKAIHYTIFPTTVSSLYSKSVFVVKGREIGSTEWTFSQKMYLDTEKFPYRLNAFVNNAPGNFEFYIETREYKNDSDNQDGLFQPADPGFDIRPASDDATGVTLIKEVPVNVLPQTFGGQGTFKVEKGGSFMICFDAPSMTVRAYQPDGNPYRVIEKPKNLYLIGDMKLVIDGEKVRINKWTTLDSRLQLEDMDHLGQANRFKHTIEVYDDSYFRISTEDDAVKGWWDYTCYLNEDAPNTTDGSQIQQVTANVRGNWSPQTYNDVDVPLTGNRARAIGTYFQTTPGEGPRFHLPKGMYDIYVEYIDGNLDPNCLKVYAMPYAEKETYYLSVTDCNSTSSTMYPLTGDGSKLSCTFYSDKVKTSAYGYAVEKELMVYKFEPASAGEAFECSPYTGITLDQPFEIARLGAIPTSPTNNFTREGMFKFELDLSDPDALKGTVSEPDDVNMPLKTGDFKDADGNPKPHYFFVGSRTGDFRLLPEWELTEANGYKIENRLMYPGMFGIAKVDNYDDYIHHRFNLYITFTSAGSGDIVNEVKDYPLYRDPYTAMFKQSAITDYGNYDLAEDKHNDLKWPYYVIYESGESDSYDYQSFVASWWHFCEFPATLVDENNSGSYHQISEAFKKGTPSLATFHIELDAEGNPSNLWVDKATTWQQDKQAILDEVNFMLCGTNITNESRKADGTPIIDPRKNPLNGYTNVTDWANQWIQYDQTTGLPYTDAYGKYLPMTVYQDSWMKDHPVLFYREADDYHYTSNDIILRPLKEIEAEAAKDATKADKFLQYYRDMKDLKDQMLGDGTLKKTTASDAAIKYDFYDQVGYPDIYNKTMDFRKGDIATPDGGWQPYVLSDISFGGIFKVWSGYGGGHAGFGAWRDDIVPGDGYAWFNLNVGHYLARNPLRVNIQDVEKNASKATEPAVPNYNNERVDFYITGKDDPAADFMTAPDEDGVYDNKEIQRLILWLNPEDRTDMNDNRTSGLAKSYVQLILSSHSPVIRAYFGATSRTICYAWHLVRENVVEDKTIDHAEVTVFRNGQQVGDPIAQDVHGKKASECLEEKPFTMGELKNQLPGEYWFRVDVTYTDGEKDAVSNRLSIFPEMVPAEITAEQKTVETDGKTYYGFSVNGTVGMAPGNDNKEIISYPVSETESKWVYLKDIIAGFEVRADGKLLPDSDDDTSNGNVPYTAGATSPFHYLLSGEKQLILTAKPVLKTDVIVPAADTYDNRDVVLTPELLQQFIMTEVSTEVDVVVPRPVNLNNAIKVTSEPAEGGPMTYPADENHPGHHDIAPVYYHTVNNVTLIPSWTNNVILEGNGEDNTESVTYSVTRTSGVATDLYLNSELNTQDEYNDLSTPIEYVGVSVLKPQSRGYGSRTTPCEISVDTYVVLHATYSRGGKEIYHEDASMDRRPTIKLYGPDNFSDATIKINNRNVRTFIVGSAYYQPLVSDIIKSSDDTEERRVYDMRIPIDKSNRGLCTDDSKFADLAIYGGFNTSAISSQPITACGHDNSSPEYGKHPQPVPYVCSKIASTVQNDKLTWQGTDWKGLDNYTPWFSETSGIWSQNKHEWASRIATEPFAVEIPHISCSTDGNSLKTNPFYLNCYLVYPFLVKTRAYQKEAVAETQASTTAGQSYLSELKTQQIYAPVYIYNRNYSNVVTGIDAVETDGDADARHDVCTPAGMVILRDVTLEEAERTLAPGIYLFGSEKIVIK